ncbi:MAG: DUF7079 family protein [Cyclobacteriaceae bacterium]
MKKDREPIWIALSDLYLDTELQDFTLDHIANTIQGSPYTLEEVRKIDRQEVFPLLQQNLHSVAGVWGAFESEWVIKECAQQQKKRKNWWYRRYCDSYYFVYGGMHKQLWKEIEKRMH